MKDHLILISIGPVQDFIASARKLRDLWFGSEMLSELSKVVAKSLKEQGCELIFPFVSSVEELEKHSELIVANKIFAKSAGDKSPNEIIKTAKLAWEKAQIDYGITALNKIRSIKKIQLNKDLYEKQIGDSGEFFASWVELSDNYQESKDKLEKALAGRKNLRDFKKSNWDGCGLRKSSLDGARETVFIGKPQKIVGLIKKNEYLDALGCVKRFYPISSRTSKHFEDLSDIALIPYLDKIYQDDDLEGLLSEYESYFDASTGLRSPQSRKHTNTKLKIVSDLLYAGKNDLEDIPGAWKALRKLTNKDNAGEPPKYACILLGDGDKMGVALDKIRSYHGHQTFSKGLAKFADEVEDIIEGFDGNLIYAGGDDVMAYLPLHTAVEASNEVRLLFVKCMDDIFNELKLDKSDLPTFSIGLAIVHHSAPLDSALDIARKAEGIAKKDGGRNALAIIQSKRGGSDISIYGKWERDDENLGLYKRINKMIDMYNNESSSLSHTLGYQLRQVKIECGDGIKFTKNGDDLIPENAVAVGITRIFEQKLKCKNKRDESDNLKSLLNGRGSVKRLSNELVITRQIAELIKMAGPKKEVN